MPKSKMGTGPQPKQDPVLEPKHVVVPTVSSVAPPPSVAVPVVHEAPRPAVTVSDVSTLKLGSSTTPSECAPLPWFATPLVVMGVGLVFAWVLLWGLSCSLEVGRLTKQQNDLMITILETLRR